MMIVLLLSILVLLLTGLTDTLRSVAIYLVSSMANNTVLINHVGIYMFLSVQPVCMCVLHACVHSYFIENKHNL